MREKIIAGFFGVLSWAVWGVTISGIFFLVFLLCTGHLRQPTLTPGEAVLAPAAADDAALAARGFSTEDWYVLTVPVEVRGSALSPYDYSCSGFVLTSPSFPGSFAHFIASPADEIVFSRAKPVSFDLILYIRCPAGPETLQKALDGAEFCMRDYYQQLGFFGGYIDPDLPGFTLDRAPTLTAA